MRPIPATRLGHAHGLLRAIEKRGRLRTDEFVTEFNLSELFPPDLENALGRMRHFISYARLAGLVKEDRGVVELTEVGKRYVRAGDPDAPYDVSPQQAEWLRRQLREKHMTDSIFHGLAIGLSLLASVPAGTRVATMDFGRSMAYLGRAGWDNENTLAIQGERHLVLLTDLELIDDAHALTPTGHQVRNELTLPVHMSLLDLAAQQNPGGAEAVRAAAAAEWAQPEPEPEPEPEPPVASEAPPAVPDEDDNEDNGYHTVVGPAPTTAPDEPSHPPIVPRATPHDPIDVAPLDRPPTLSPGDPLLGFAVPSSASAGPPAAPPDDRVAPPEPEAADDAIAASPTSGPPLTPGDPLAATAPSAGPPVTPGDPTPAGPSAGPPVTPAGPSSAPPVTPSDPVPPAPTAASSAPPVAPSDPAPAAPAAPSSAPPVTPSDPVPAASAAPADPVPSVPDGPSFAPPVAPGDPAPAAPSSAPPVTPADPAPAGPSSAPPVTRADPVTAPPTGPSFAPPTTPAPPAPVTPSDLVPPVPAGDVGTPDVEASPSGSEVGAPPARVDWGSGPSTPPPVAPEDVVAPPPDLAPATPREPAPRQGGEFVRAFVDVGMIRAAGVAAGLRLPMSVYANAAAGLAAGKHLILTGPPGAGKTTLAMAIARAAAQAGRAHGAIVVTAAHRWAPQELLVEAAGQGKWVIADELDRARPDRALGALSTFLAGIPVALGNAKEAGPADGWRIVATWGGGAPRASAAILRRFAVVEVADPPADELHSALQQAANGDPTAVRAAERLARFADLAPLGAGVFLDAARHAAARQAAAPTDEATLTREAFAAYVAPVLGDLDEDGERRVREILEDA